jgi:hypothetical protein
MSSFSAAPTALKSGEAAFSKRGRCCPALPAALVE